MCQNYKSNILIIKEHKSKLNKEKYIFLQRQHHSDINSAQFIYSMQSKLHVNKFLTQTKLFQK